MDFGCRCLYPCLFVCSQREGIKMFNVYSQNRHACLACQSKHIPVFCRRAHIPHFTKIKKTKRKRTHQKPKPDALLDRGLPVMGAQVQRDARPLVHPSMERPEGLMAYITLNDISMFIFFSFFSCPRYAPGLFLLLICCCMFGCTIIGCV